MKENSWANASGGSGRAPARMAVGPRLVPPRGRAERTCATGSGKWKCRAI